MMEQTKLERIISGGVLLALLVGCLLVLRPFVSALLWAAVLCFSTWPFYKRLLSLVRGRRTLAAMLMTLGMILIILIFRPEDMRLLGVHVVGEQATELVHIGLMAMLAGVGASVFNRVCFNYPTLGDLYKYATYEALLKRDGVVPGAESSV